MKTSREIKELQIRAWKENDQSIQELIVVDLLLDIRDILNKK